MSTTHEITKLLVAWGEGDREALDRLAPLAHAENFHTSLWNASGKTRQARNSPSS